MIVSLDYKEGDLGVYFPVGGRLSTEFAETNNLLRKKDENGNETMSIIGEPVVQFPNDVAYSLKLDPLYTENYLQILRKAFFKWRKPAPIAEIQPYL